jgi:hypothetical protein
MSKRHNTSRRRTYGRRQHEMHERVDRRTDRRNERSWRIGPDLGLESPSYDGQTSDAPYTFAD